MPRQRFTQQEVDELSARFQRRNEAQFAWSHLVSTWYGLAGRRALWVASSYDYTNPQWLDIGGGGYHLTNNNAAQFGYDAARPLISTATLVSASSRYFSRPDAGVGNWADITGLETTIKAADRGLSMYAWIKFANAAGAQETIMGKWDSATGNRSYMLDRLAGGAIRAVMSNAGAANDAVANGPGAAQSVWTFVGLQFDPSTVLRSIVDADNVDDAAGVPASIFDGAASFTIGATGTPSVYADMDIAIAVLCASYHGLATANALYHQGVPLFK